MQEVPSRSMAKQSKDLNSHNFLDRGDAAVDLHGLTVPTRPWISRQFDSLDRLDSNRLIFNATEPRTTNTLHQNNFGVSIPSSHTAINKAIFSFSDILCSACLQRDSFSSKKGQSFDWISETCGSAGNIAWLKAGGQPSELSDCPVRTQPVAQHAHQKQQLPAHKGINMGYTIWFRTSGFKPNAISSCEILFSKPKWCIIEVVKHEEQN